MAKKQTKPKMNLGRPANVCDLFLELALKRPGAGWYLLRGKYMAVGGLVRWVPLYGLPKPGLAKTLPEWTASLLVYGDHLVAEDEIGGNALCICCCEPDYVDCLGKLMEQLLQAPA